MRKLHAGIAAGLVIALASLAVVAAERTAPAEYPKIIRLKSNGQAVAELKILGNVPGTLRADGAFVASGDKDRTVVRGTNGVMIRIGTVTVTAQEAEVVSTGQ